MLAPPDSTGPVPGLGVGLLRNRPGVQEAGGPESDVNPVASDGRAMGLPAVRGGRHQPARGVGADVLTALLLAPTLLLWLSIVWARFSATVDVIDSDGRPYRVTYINTDNFTKVAFSWAAANMTTIMAHMWLSLGIIARQDYKLDYRLQGRDTSAGNTKQRNPAKLRWQEKLHVGMIAVEFPLINLLTGEIGIDRFTEFFAGCIVPGLFVAGASVVLAGSRAVVVQHQGSNTAKFAEAAFRRLLYATIFGLVVTARFAGNSLVEAMLEPNQTGCPWQQNLDGVTNSTFVEYAYVHDCAPAAFIDPLDAASLKATFSQLSRATRRTDFRACQLFGTILLPVHMGIATMIHAMASGQGLMGDAVFSTSAMEWQHATALVLWLIGTIAVWKLALYTSSCSLRCDEAYCRSSFFASLTVFLSCAVLVLAVLWKDAVTTALQKALRIGGTADRRRSGASSIFASMRFPQGQALPEATQLQAALRDEYGIELQIMDGSSGVGAGTQLSERVFQSIEESDVFMAFGTSDYGEKTPNPACTFYESEFARNKGKHMILLRMIPWESEFEHLQARVLFGLNIHMLVWIQGEPMPVSLLEDISKALASRL